MKGFMFAVDKDRLVKSLVDVRHLLCQYGGKELTDRCDCKFATDWYPIGTGEVSGCAEIIQCIRFFTAMTDKEFIKIYNRQTPKDLRIKDKWDL